MSGRSDKQTGARFPGVMVHESAYVDEPCSIGKGTRIWHFVHILKDTVIGEDCSIGQNVMIGPAVRVGNRCKIQNNVSLYNGVELEDEVFCGPSCVFTNVNNPQGRDRAQGRVCRTLVHRGAASAPTPPSCAGTRWGSIASSRRAPSWSPMSRRLR